MNTSDQINEIAAACAKAQLAKKAALKTSTNPHYGSKYADLAAIIEVARIYAEHGVALVQDVQLVAEGVTVVTRLVHSSGQFIEVGPLTVPLGAKRDAHGVGSAATYAKRYALAGALGIASEDDDDGNVAQANAPVRTLKRPEYFGDWLKDLELAANAGMVALETTWKASHQELRDYLMQSDPDRVDKLKAAAAKVPKVKANAPA